jgi:AcrR family transcriptional regulator
VRDRLLSATKTLLHEQNRANVRAAILDAARELFATEGLPGLSMRGLADRVGYTPGTIYLYFADKDDLLSELIEEEVGRLADRLEAVAAAQPDPGRRLEAVALAYVAFGIEHPHAYEASFMLRSHPLTRESARLRHHVQGRRMLDILARVVRESGRITTRRDSQVAIQALRCALHGLTSLLVLGRTLPGVTWEAVVHHLVENIVRER